MKNRSFHAAIVTPERAVLETEAVFVALPAIDGELGVLYNRAPLLARLGPGQLRVESEDGTKVFQVEGGFAQMVDNRLTVLAESATPVAD